jgi:hypothetical protein
MVILKGVVIRTSGGQYVPPGREGQALRISPVSYQGAYKRSI